MHDLLLDVPRSPGVARARALTSALRDAIRTGRLPAGAPVPSSRALAAQVGLARSTVVGVYEQLVAEGFLIARHGSGTVVAEVHVPSGRRDVQPTRAMRVVANFVPGEPDTGSFPRGRWLASMRRVMSASDAALFGYGDQRGLLELRRALTSYLGRTRGVLTDPSRVLVFGGATTALALLVETLRRSGLRRLAIEDPGMPFHRAIFERLGVELVPIPVDADGIRTDDLAATDADVVVVTPAHQYPLGGTLSPERRAALVSWARHRGAWILEDDYDGEFRYDRQPIGALQALDPDRVAYCGTASKTIAPGVRVGWLALPAQLVPAVVEFRAWRGGASQIDQAVLADLIDSGAFDAHVRKMRTTYRRRRDLLLRRLADDAPELEVDGIAAGQHFTALLPSHVEEQDLIAAAAERGIALYGLAAHRVADGRSGLVIGFSRPHEHEFPAAVETLCAFLRGALVKT